MGQDAPGAGPAPVAPAGLSKADWDARGAALARMTKARLIAYYRAGIRAPDGSVVQYGWSAHPLEKWTKEEIIGSVLSVEFPGGPQ
jgi:hypothetical protein